MPLQMVPVVSSMINAVGFDDDTGILAVTFSNGRTYRYAGVPLSEFQALVDAPSVGSYFSQNIKNVYRSA